MISPARFLTGLSALLLVASSTQAADPPGPPDDSARFVAMVARMTNAVQRLEFTQMLSAVLTGSDMGPGDGWFKKQGQSRYDWNWLAKQFDTNGDGRITRKEFKGPAEWFDRLDRDHNGVITKSDLDWTDSSPYWNQHRLAMQILRRADKDGDQKISREEWEALFKQLAHGKDSANADDLRTLLFPPQPPQPGKSDGPSKGILLKGLLTGELGSPREGPKIGDQAPDFTLNTPDGKQTITLSKFHGHKPVVLIFGSFT